MVGAGIGGTSAGIALQRLGHEVVIYDRMRENRPVGAALSLWSNGVKVLNWLGLSEEVAALGGRMETMSYRDGADGETWCRFPLDPVASATGQRPYPVARADLQALLMRTFGTERIHLGKELVGITDDGERVTAHFADGTSDTGDVLLGADGARSLTRAWVNEGGAPIERSYCGYTNYNGLVPADDRIGPLTEWTTYVGEGKRCAVMPVAGERFYFWFDVPQPAGLPYDRTDGKQPLLDAFGAWGAPGVRTLLEAIDPASSLNRVEIWDIDPFDTWTRGRVAILGDAAHNTTPDIGQGACSALEDAFALGIAVATDTVSVEDTLRRYAASRVERAGDLVLRARARAAETHGADPEVTANWYRGLRGTDGAGIIRGIVGNIAGSPINLGAGVL